MYKLYIYIFITESFCCTPENDTAVQKIILKRVNILEGMTKNDKTENGISNMGGMAEKFSQCS